MGRIMLKIIRNIYLDPLFIIGLLIRIIIVGFVTPLAVKEWYSPFLEASVNTISIDPWSVWMSNGGQVEAFPYGYAMWIVFLPMTLLSELLNIPMQYSYAITLIAADICLLYTLNLLLPDRKRLLLLVYWLSPIVVLSGYMLGFNDLIPALLVAISIFLLRRVNLVAAGVLFAVAISAKFSMVVALPFLGIYLYNNRRLRGLIPRFFLGFVLALLALGIPFMISKSAVEMLVNNPEMGKIYSLALDVGGSITIYLLPLFYIIMLYMVWRIKRLNFELFQATTGISFLVIVLMTPASPGWFVWSIPFIVFHQTLGDRLGTILFAGFSILYVLDTLIVTPIHLSSGSEIALNGALNIFTGSDTYFPSLIHTCMVATGAVLSIRMWQEAVNQNDFFRLSRKPFVIGVAGDSGSGKDTFSNSIIGLFGNHSVVKLSGDDYHLWDRNKAMWKVLTHLNPMANDLERFSRDLVSLVDGRSIKSRHYDHQTGKLSKLSQVKSNDFIIASGLHALYRPILRECYDLSVYLDVDEELRRYWKIKRDIKQRNQTSEQVINSLDTRESDSARFIRPQSQYADLIFSLQPMNRNMLKDFDNDNHPKLKLVARTTHGFNELSLNKVLVGVCGLHVEMPTTDGMHEIQMSIEGNTSRDEIAMAAEILSPRIPEFLDHNPKWQEGVDGIMQLITVSHISQSLTKRFI